MTFDASVENRLSTRLERIYGEQAELCLPLLLELMERYRDLRTSSADQLWDHRDIVLITYGDQVRADGQKPLETLREFLADVGLDKLINTVHLLPFCPYTSDDGFSVVDYCAVDPDLGSWDDIRALGEHVDLVFDLVLNHISQESRWFQRYLAGDSKYTNYFIEVDPDEDLSLVTRPRSTPLLTPFETSRGTRFLWTTFSSDQIDLNYENPDVLLDVLEVLLCYIRRGARFIRLDAVGYLWKQVGTHSIHLPRTHSVVKLMRDVVDILAPHVVLLTETNVPHRENVSYFGDADEAHMVYQFSLPPLLLDALLQHDARPFNEWLDKLDDMPRGTTFFNFTASHDGIGVRPLEGLVSDGRLDQLVSITRERGGFVGTKRNADGTDVPYELNITYLDALIGPESDNLYDRVRRFLASQAIMLALRGIPGVYFHSLVGTRNDTKAARESRIPRRINRRKFRCDELSGVLSEETIEATVFRAYRRLVGVRIQQPAFHPDGHQTVWPSDDSTVIAFLRTSPDATERILVVANLMDAVHPFQVASEPGVRVTRDLLTGAMPMDGVVTLEPYQVMWLQVESC